MDNQELVELENTIVECSNVQSQNIDGIIACLNNITAELQKLNAAVSKHSDDFAEATWGGAKNASNFWKRMLFFG